MQCGEEESGRDVLVSEIEQRSDAGEVKWKPHTLSVWTPEFEAFGSSKRWWQALPLHNRAGLNMKKVCVPPVQEGT